MQQVENFSMCCYAKLTNDGEHRKNYRCQMKHKSVPESVCRKRNSLPRQLNVLISDLFDMLNICR